MWVELGWDYLPMGGVCKGDGCCWEPELLMKELGLP